MSEPVTLEQVAAARESARLRVERAEAALKALEPGMDAAHAERDAACEELARIELVLHSAKAADLIGRAVEAQGVATGEPPMVLVPGYRLPDVYKLVALGPAGVGLYLHAPEVRGRYGGKTYALRVDHVPQAVLDVLEAEEALRGRVSATRAERLELRERMASALTTGAVYEVKRVHRSDELVAWMERGGGSFGAGSGARKPLPPPGGGRWRWLKVPDEQSALMASHE